MKKSCFTIHLDKFQIHASDERQYYANRGETHHWGESFLVLPTFTGVSFCHEARALPLSINPSAFLLHLENPLVPNSLASNKYTHQVSDLVCSHGLYFIFHGVHHSFAASFTSRFHVFLWCPMHTSLLISEQWQGIMLWLLRRSVWDSCDVDTASSTRLLLPMFPGGIGSKFFCSSGLHGALSSNSYNTESWRTSLLLGISCFKNSHLVTRLQSHTLLHVLREHIPFWMLQIG